MLVRYLAGLGALLLVAVPIGAASHAWVSRLRPDWFGALARLAEIVVGLALTLCVMEILGSVSLFETAAVLPALAVVGCAGWWAAQRIPRRASAGTAPPAVREPPKSPHSMNLVALAAVAVVAADWATRTVDAYHHGMSNIDTLWYHLPFAARFVQSHTITPLHFFDLETVTAFFPASSELFHALGILLMGNDVLSPLVNIGWLSLALLAGWCAGRPFGVGPVTLTGVAALLVTPNIVATQPGGGYDDIVGLALLLSIAAVLINVQSDRGSRRVPAIAIAGLAAGLAMGTKFTSVVPVFLLTIGVLVVARRGRRLVEGSVWLVGVALTGSFWYIRNWVAGGNPLPSVHLKLGPFSLANPTITTPSSTVFHFVFRSIDWRLFFLPGLRQAFGPVWWALLALSAAGLFVGIVRASGSTTRMLAVMGLAIAAAFLFTPQYLATYGAPIFFVDNVRYVDPAIVLGIVLVPLIPGWTRKPWSWCLLVGFAGIVAVSQLDGTIWPLTLLSRPFAAPITGWDSALGAVSGFAVLIVGLMLVTGRGSTRRMPIRGGIVALVAVLCGALVAAGFGLQQFYMSHRYAAANLNPPFSWARTISGARIGVAGAFTQLQYALYGENLTNYVQYIGVQGPHGSYAPAADCAQWRRLVNEGRYEYILTSTGLVTSRGNVFKTPYSYTVWTGHDPASRLVQRTIWTLVSPGGRSFVGFSVFRINGDLNVAACSSSVLKQVESTPP